MATQGVAGRRGFVAFSATSSGTATKLTEVTEYEIVVEQAQADASSFDSSGWNEHIPVTRQWRLEYSIVPSSGNYAASINGWTNFLSDVTVPSKRWMTLRPSSSSTAGWQGTALSESGEISGDLGDVMRMDFVWQGHGPLIHST